MSRSKKGFARRKARAAAKIFEAAGIPRTGRDLELCELIINYGGEENIAERLKQATLRFYPKAKIYPPSRFGNNLFAYSCKLMPEQLECVTKLLAATDIRDDEIKLAVHLPDENRVITVPSNADDDVLEAAAKWAWEYRFQHGVVLEFTPVINLNDDGAVLWDHDVEPRCILFPDRVVIAQVLARWDDDELWEDLIKMVDEGNALVAAAMLTLTPASR